MTQSRERFKDLMHSNKFLNRSFTLMMRNKKTIKFVWNLGLGFNKTLKSIIKTLIT